MTIARAAEIDERWDTRRANGYVSETQSPWPAEGVADDDGDALTGLFAEGRGKAAGGTIWIFWQKRDEIAARDV